MSGRRCDELGSQRVYFLSILARGGAYKYYRRAPDDTGVSLDAGAKFDPALSAGSRCIFMIDAMGGNGSLALLPWQTLSQQNGGYYETKPKQKAGGEPAAVETHPLPQFPHR